MAIQQVRVQINGVWTTLTLNSTSGKYEGTVTAPGVTSYNVNTGHYYPVAVEATDMAGNATIKDDTDATLGGSLKLTIKEATAPTITITAPTASANLKSDKPAISFQLRDETNGSGVAIGTLSLQVDSGTAVNNTASGMVVTNATNGYDVTYTPPSALSQGSHTVKIDVKDNDGNVAAQKSVTFTVDTVAPALTVSAPASNGLYVNNKTYSVKGVATDATSGIQSVTIKLGATDQGTITVDGSGNFTKDVTLAGGENTISVTATDKAGNITTVTRTINLDTIAPTVSAVTITPNPAKTGESFVIVVSVSD